MADTVTRGDLVALSTISDLRVLHDAGDVLALRLPCGALDLLSRRDRERLHALVIRVGLEVWREGDEYVFRRTHYPPSGARGRAMHRARHAWLLG